MLHKLIAVILTVVLALGAASAEIFTPETETPGELSVNVATPVLNVESPAPEETTAPVKTTEPVPQPEETTPVAEVTTPAEPVKAEETPKPTEEPKPTEPVKSEEKPVETKPEEKPVQEKKQLTAEEAKAAALKHAKLSTEEVTGLRAEKDKEGKTVHWDVEFRNGNWEYDYEIHAESGKVLKNEKEYDKPDVKPTEAPKTEEKPVETKPEQKPVQEKKQLTAEEAKAAALKHAKLSAEEVTGLRAEKDKEGKTVHWDVEFRNGNWEYDYEIHAESGKVLTNEKEYDEPDVKPTEAPVPTEEPKPTEPPKEEKKELTAADAKAIALDHAKLSASQVRELSAEKDRDDGLTIWEVEFESGNWEYSYEINAENGKIVNWEKDD